MNKTNIDELFDIEAAIKFYKTYSVKGADPFVLGILKAAIGDKHLIEAPVEKYWDGKEQLKAGMLAKVKRYKNPVKIIYIGNDQAIVESDFSDLYLTNIGDIKPIPKTETIDHTSLIGSDMILNSEQINKIPDGYLYDVIEGSRFRGLNIVTITGIKDGYKLP